MVRILGAPSDTPPPIVKPKAKEQFDVITNDDLYKADEHMTKEILWYAGYTALTVAIFLILVACFASDPRAFIIAFGTGSPCCLLSPCVKNLYKYTDPAKLIQMSINTYVPGLLVEDDGSMQMYEPSGEEIDLLYELINELIEVS